MEISKKLQNHIKQELKISTLHMVNKIEVIKNRSQANRYLSNSNEINNKQVRNS